MARRLGRLGRLWQEEIQRLAVAEHADPASARTPTGQEGAVEGAPSETRVDEHPLGCQRPRIADAVVFDKFVRVLVVGAGYARIADAPCSATTLRGRRDEGIRLGLWERLNLACRDAYDKMIGVDRSVLAVDGCLPKAPGGGACAGRSPVDRGTGEPKRSPLTEGAGIPLAALSAPANAVEHALRGQTLEELKDFQPLPAEATVHRDAGYDYRPCREELHERGLHGQIAPRGEPAPIRVGRRWVIERTNSWFNDFGKLRRCTERRQRCVDAYFDLAAAIVTIRALLGGAWLLYRWDSRPRSQRIR